MADDTLVKHKTCGINLKWLSLRGAPAIRHIVIFAFEDSGGSKTDCLVCYSEEVVDILNVASRINV